ncbi:MAG: cellulase family glycosylhydrolase, partial [Chitinophagaceae bacterium]
QMKKRFFPLILIFIITFQIAGSQDTTQRWSQQKAWDWYNKQPWLCGFNYIPAYAINYTAMWDKTTFDPVAIDKELSLAEKSGMNVLRAVLQFAVYEDDPAWFLKTLDVFMSVCEKHRIKFVPALFDDCVFGITHDPKTGIQPEPLKGWYAWAWSPSPGHSMVIDEQTHPRIEKYVKAVMGRFKDDQRVMMWDLYNEPTNGGLGSASFPLLKKVISWARTINPSQPLTVDIWNQDKRLNEIALAGSDVISFHNYGNREVLLNQIKDLKKYNRPVICTEWMNRPAKSLIATNLVVFYEEKVGCMLWGLVNGKTQTDLPWGHRPGDPVSPVWQHDLYRPDLTAYDAEEIKTITKFIDNSKNR